MRTIGTVESESMVATSHAEVTAAALTVLADGGTAVDAALTAMVLQQVVQPQLSTLAGGFGMLGWHPDAGPWYLNAGPDRPRGSAGDVSATEDSSGARVAVPGVIAGMRVAMERFGSRPWSSCFAPAIAAAEEGVLVDAAVGAAIAGAADRLTLHPSGRDRYTDGGMLLATGQHWRQPRLARTLRRLVEEDGVDWFYRGPFADRFAAAVRGSGGTMSSADLADYAPRWDDPLRFRHRGHTVLGTPLPDTGGLFCALALDRVRRSDLFSGSSPWWTSGAAVVELARFLTEAESLVDAHAVDPRGTEDPTPTLLVARSAPGPTGRGADHPTGSNQIVVVDDDGRWVCLLHTGYGTDFGTGLVVDGVGVNAANLFPGATDGPGRRILAPLASTLVLDESGPWAALGTPGHPAPAVAQVLVNLLQHDLPLEEAIDAPRITVGVGPAQEVWAEDRLGSSVREVIARHGFAVRALEPYDRATGRFQAVIRRSVGGGDRLVGIVDPRGPGRAAGLGTLS